MSKLYYSVCVNVTIEAPTEAVALERAAREITLTDGVLMVVCDDPKPIADPYD